MLWSQPSIHPCEPDLPGADLANTRSNAARQGRVAAAEATGHRRTQQRAWGLQRPLSYSQLNGRKAEMTGTLILAGNDLRTSSLWSVMLEWLAGFPEHIDWGLSIVSRFRMQSHSLSVKTIY